MKQSDEWVPTTSRTIVLEQDGDDLIMPIPDDLMEEAGWKIGDSITFTLRDDGSLIMSKTEHITHRQFLTMKPFLAQVGAGIISENNND